MAVRQAEALPDEIRTHTKLVQGIRDVVRRTEI
jgi:hypothetical protein